MINAENLNWEKVDGLIPAIIQDVATRQVLMLGYMNAEAVALTQETGKVHFYSRTKQRIWKKGETSGNTFKLVQMAPDCDGDTLLVEVRPKGPACHTGTVTCFGDDPAPGLGFLAHLRAIIKKRRKEKPKNSYVGDLLARAPKKPAQKVGEEGVEVAMAAVSEGKSELAGEAADLIFHLMVLLESRDLSLDDVVAVLRKRHAVRAQNK
ncbi:MAG: bifunctional phosphoribosyl-AMP cyclohydrolase/phosphoribosyl-ATP diphosphatase HisIE [Maricaulis sp.]|jgi:phosphoribosyl-ATP pyrophosphohydrolase/phosphoribosyl-AMP cyclohydrolase|uniref:bifunctional phosphoribosyl-AMP cyclohydrolase/phosphoribosyl-ATP diphosphatase HisIE n=1 Tax=Maricaulis sp. TaxID=1486257 RepID=UPI001B07495F|nr:bifunctional phosphoribosyl-AMP cyclohydrolase/phosphoribosyl-ATP diphosphatase HisIE [Maricaulis sp.]MBO6730261.1 bifunctional phosphoribosyl-AMP cyclohydrolase/phosphoribosyl-ATP diphosphatase HisIE [Maricaulis sp.]MBO6847385.1 bifunctional phosphoribosyl-AMP cyclohydrolase/phosphoribosyl-ATP diphosphatase HisIE [Maricaulis sp.]MBO6876415.1 bifunctional phosphoribosyl-AMP cyclohydrolase/phosphoribosyl-ATP diphosphatase HisIE [Maricaulis sp.]